MTGSLNECSPRGMVGTLLLGTVLACSSAPAVAQGLNAPPADVDGVRVEQKDDQSKQIASEAAQGTDQPESDVAPTPALLWKGLIQGGYVGRSNPRGESANEFRLREAQISVEGSPIPDTHFFIEVNFPGPGEKVELNDAFVTLDLAKEFRVVAGQLRVPLNRPAVSARTSLFVTEPRAAGPVQRKARDRGINLVFTPFEGRLLYEQALVNGNGILAGELGNDDDSLLLQGRLVWFATGKWPLPLPAQTDLQHSPWSTFIKAGWASGKFDKGLNDISREKVRETTWNVGQAIVGKGLYGYWQYSRAYAAGSRNFDTHSFSVTTGYAVPLRRLLAIGESAPPILKTGWLEPKFQYETLGYDDPLFRDQLNRKIYRFGLNFYPLGIPDLRLMVDNEVAVRPHRSRTLSISLHYMF